MPRKRSAEAAEASQVTPRRSGRKRAATETELAAKAVPAKEHKAAAPSSGRRFWLIKSEPDVRIEKGHDVSCSIDALEKQGVVPWEGVRNPEARNYMKDQMSMGDLALFYHSNCKVPGVVGIARVASAPYADPSQFDKTSPYYDARSTAESPRWMLVDFAFERRLGRLVSLHEIRATRELADMVLLRRMRLSVQPVDADAFDVIVRLGDTPASP